MGYADRSQLAPGRKTTLGRSAERVGLARVHDKVAGARPGNIMGRVSERDDGIAVHYLTVSRGTPIYASDGEQVGKVVRVLDNHREHILDGIVFEDADGTVRFVDGPEVQRTFERAVELNIDAGAARELGPPPASGVAGAVKNSKLGRLLGR